MVPIDNYAGRRTAHVHTMGVCGLKVLMNFNECRVPGLGDKGFTGSDLGWRVKCVKWNRSILI